MTKLNFGLGAYLRQFAGAPEIKLENRFIEKMPTNLREGVGLLARPGTTLLTTAVPDTNAGTIRRTYSKLGLFNGDLFIVSGSNLYRLVAADDALLQISGEIGSGIPKFTWDVGPGYEHLFVADGVLLQLFAGGTHASGNLTATSTPTDDDIIEIGGTYFGWNTNVDINSPKGTSAHPWIAHLGPNPIQAMADLLNFTGTPGIHFSSALTEANTLVTADTQGGPPATQLDITAITDLASGDDITVSVFAGTDVTWSGQTHLLGGGVMALEGVYVSTGEPINALCTLDHFVMASVSGSNKMFFIEPGDDVINALNFFSKESNPDPILDLLTVGDTFLAAGAGSIETWYPTGETAAPFAPIEGRTFARGIVDGTLVLVQETPMFVGADGIVYALGQSLDRVSNHGIEERIREQLRLEIGIT